MNLSLHSKVIPVPLFEVTVFLKSWGAWSYVILVSTSPETVLLNCGGTFESVEDPV